MPRNEHKYSKFYSQRACLHVRHGEARCIYATVTGRRKGVYSIYKKMVQKKRNFEQLNDIYGFRIIVDNVDDCYRALGVIHNNYMNVTVLSVTGKIYAGDIITSMKQQ